MLGNDVRKNFIQIIDITYFHKIHSLEIEMILYLLDESHIKEILELKDNLEIVILKRIFVKEF